MAVFILFSPRLSPSRDLWRDLGTAAFNRYLCSWAAREREKLGQSHHRANTVVRPDWPTVGGFLQLVSQIPRALPPARARRTRCTTSRLLYQQDPWSYLSHQAWIFRHSSERWAHPPMKTASSFFCLSTKPSHFKSSLVK